MILINTLQTIQIYPELNRTVGGSWVYCLSLRLKMP